MAGPVTCNGAASITFGQSDGWDIIINDGGTWGQYEYFINPSLGGPGCFYGGGNLPFYCQEVPVSDGGFVIQAVIVPGPAVCTNCNSTVDSICAEASTSVNAYWTQDQVSSSEFIWTSISPTPIETCTGPGADQPNPLAVTFTLQ